MISSALIGAVVAVLFAQPAAAASLTGDPWTEPGGGAEATRVIASCLASVSSSELQHAKDRCIDQPFDVCEDRHGASQMAVDECTAFALEAWRRRLNEQIARTRALAGHRTAAFNLAQRSWRIWNDKECDFQVPPNEIGSMLGQLREHCALAHTAQRALELEALADDWEDHPPS